MTKEAFRVDRRRFLLIAAASTAALAGCAAHPGSVAPSSGGPASGGPATAAPGTTGATPSTSSRETPAPSTGALSSPAPDTTPTASSTTDAPAPVQALRGTTPRRTSSDPAAAATALPGFGLDLLRAVGAAAPNTAISPYSLYAVLAMARAGAKGATADQLDAALQLTGTYAQGGALTAVDDGIAAAIKAAGSATPMTILAANQTWVQQGFPVHPEYLDTLASQFGAQAVAADFAADPEAVRAAINTWVSQRTNNLIPDLFPSGSISRDVLLALVNALYLKASWEKPFTKSPQPTPFTTADGRSVPAAMMSAGHPLQGASGKGWTSVSVPYSGGGLAMTLLLPDAGQFDTTLKSMDATTITAASAATDPVQLTMPTFTIHSVPAVQQAIQQMGVIDLFTNSADLSGIAGKPGELMAGSFVHQCVIKVDENGTEAAAASGMSMVPTYALADPRIMIIDRPFLFWIHESATGAPLFLGAVSDPTA